MLWRVLVIATLVMLGALTTDYLFNLASTPSDLGFIGGLLLSLLLWAVILTAIFRLFKAIILHLYNKAGASRQQKEQQCKSDSSSQQSS